MKVFTLHAGGLCLIPSQAAPNFINGTSYTDVQHQESIEIMITTEVSSTKQMLASSHFIGTDLCIKYVRLGTKQSSARKLLYVAGIMRFGRISYHGTRM